MTAYLTVQQMVTSGANRGTSTNDIDRFSVEALKKLPAGERAERGEEARSALARNPLNANVLLDLSHLAEAEGDSDAAERLKLIAGQLRPRATAVQAEAMEILLRRRDFDSVMNRLDGLIRARPQQAQDFFAVAAGIASAEDGSKAVARMLATDPPWRPQFFAYVISKGMPGTTQRIFSDMRAMNIPVGSRELSALIDDLLKKNDVDGAYAVWLSGLSETELKEVKRVYDGNFSQPIRNLRFDWTVTPGEGFSYRLFPRNTASMDQTLQIDFRNFAGSFANLSQILQLKPGRYSLSGEARFEDYQSASALVFRLYCAEAGKMRLLDESPSLPQSSQWMSFDKPFEVPDGACPYQLLTLESKTKLETSQTTLGLVAIDAISVDTLPELAP
ncbi:tetratricopeptide repeat protein [Aestuariivirga sp.]|uniref:tetratricopeptide repeat protein n=1 Tax=Aestuariivirga sp. TaxID=2650926 RepID=UPI003BA90B10